MKFIPSQVTRSVGRQLLVVKKYSPNIMFVGGVIGVVGSAVLACRATLKLGDTLDDFKSGVHKVEMQAASNREYAEADQYKKDTGMAYIKGTYSVIKLYTPAVALGILSVSALTGSHITLTRRNASLTAAYAGIAKAYEEYRNRVRQEVGDDRELNLYRGIFTEKIDDDGKTKDLSVVDVNKMSPYARLFDEYCSDWQKNPELNRMFLTAKQNYFNHLLHARGHVFLNEVYDGLGMDHTKAGQVVGWVRDGGDNYIDFGIYEATNSRFLNGWEPSIILDFNVDGVILDKI